MPDYSKGRIYKIECNITKKIYVGSTINTLSRRLQYHKSGYKNWLKDQAKYGRVSSYGIIENGDYVIVLLENYQCESKEQLFAKEREWIEKIECVNKNRRVAITDEEEKERNKKWREENKEKITENKKEYYIKNKEKITEKQKHHEEEHKEKYKEYRKEYYIKNKEKIQKYMYMMHICECGTQYNTAHKSRHLKSKKHINFKKNQI